MRAEEKEEVRRLLNQVRSLFGAAIGTSNPADQAQAVGVAGHILVWLLEKFPKVFPDEWVQQLSQYLKHTDPTLQSLRGRFEYLRKLVDRFLRQLDGK